MRLSIMISLTAMLVGTACTSARSPAAEAPPFTPPPILSSTPDPYDTQAPMRPLHGRPLTGPTGLRLMIASGPTILFDLDSLSTRRVTGLPTLGGDVSDALLRVGASTVVNQGCIGCAGTPRVYVVPPGSSTARRIATGTAVAATGDGRGVWLMTQPGRGRCALRQIGLDGRTVSDARPIDCHFHPRAETSLGFLAGVHGSNPPEDEILATNTLKPIFRGDRIIHVMGHRVLTGEPGEPLRLTDVRTGRTTSLPAPSPIGHPSYGVPSPDGRWLAVSFDRPAWPGPRQRMDLWLLSIGSLRWRHVPSMPIPLALKATGMAWTDDNRLVLLGTFDATADKDMDETFDAVAVWRPGDQQLAIRRLSRPPGGTGSFVMLDRGD